MVKQLVAGWLDGWSVSQLVDQMDGWMVSQSIGWPDGWINWSVGWLID